jgi:hydrogenase maturation protease
MAPWILGSGVAKSDRDSSFMRSRRTIVVGLGNPVRTDDAVGLRVIEALAKHDLPRQVTLETAGTCGIGILDVIAGFDELVLVDAIDAGEAPGTVLELTATELETLTPLHAASSHDADLMTALATGARLGLELPSGIAIVAIQVADIATLAEALTPEVEEAVESAAKVVCEIVASRSMVQ